MDTRHAVCPHHTHTGRHTYRREERSGTARALLHTGASPLKLFLGRRFYATRSCRVSVRRSYLCLHCTTSLCACVCDVCRHRVQHRRRHPTFTHITDGDGADGEEALGHACANPKWFHKCGTPIFFPSFPFFLSIHATHLIIVFIKLNRHSVTLRIVHSHTTRNRKKKNRFIIQFIISAFLIVTRKQTPDIIHLYSPLLCTHTTCLF